MDFGLKLIQSVFTAIIVIIVFGQVPYTSILDRQHLRTKFKGCLLLPCLAKCLWRNTRHPCYLLTWTTRLHQGKIQQKLLSNHLFSGQNWMQFSLRTGLPHSWGFHCVLGNWNGSIKNSRIVFKGNSCGELYVLPLIKLWVSVLNVNIKIGDSNGTGSCADHSIYAFGRFFHKLERRQRYKSDFLPDYVLVTVQVRFSGNCAGVG